MLRRFALAACTLLLATSCAEAGDDNTKAADSPTPSAALSSSARPTDNSIPCVMFNDAFHLLFDETAQAAIIELRDNPKPDAARQKLMDILTAYASAIEQAQSSALNPDLAKALGDDAAAARAAVRQIEPTKAAGLVYIAFTKYRLNNAKEVAKHCDTGSASFYFVTEEARAQMR